MQSWPKKYWSLVVLIVFFGVPILAEAKIEKYFLSKVLDYKIIVEDSYGDQYLVEYGIGCLSMWRYEGEYIYIEQGTFLDGFGDKIYLFDSDDECRVWDVEELGNTGSGFYESNSYSYPDPLALCPENSTYSGGSCVCDGGYVAINNICITTTQACQTQYGVNSYGNSEFCYCSTGYEFNQERTQCIRSQTKNEKLSVGSYIPPPEYIQTEPAENNFDVLETDVTPLRATGALTVSAKFRKCPSQNCGIIRYYAEGSVLTITGEYKDREWYRIDGTTDAGGSGIGVIGWISKSLFEPMDFKIIEEDLGTLEITGQNDKAGLFRTLWDAFVVWWKS